MNLTKVFIALIITISLFGCESNDNSSTNSQEEINLEEAKLTDFIFEEIKYEDIKITQPTIENNKEIEEGEIIITIPNTTTSLLLSLKSINIDSDTFNISPPVGTQELFSETEFVKYTITPKSNFENSIHYNVKLILTPVNENEKLAITSFELLSNDTSAFTDIDLIKEAKSLQTIDSLLVCLFPKSIDFSDLTPAIKYQGTKIEYRVNDTDFTEYPIATGKKINFEYPNTVDFKVTNATNSQSIVYRIIVDSEQPISFDKPEVVIPDLKVGDTFNGVNVATWTNEGNYPITTMSPNEYTLVKSPIEGINTIFAVTLSKSSGGNINPKETGIVNVVITNTPIEGEYEATALFKLNFNENSWKIVNTPTDDFINDIGYKISELLKVKGTLVN